MNIPASIATVLAILGFFLIFNGSSIQRQEVKEIKTERVEITADNNQAYGLNMRKFMGIICLIAAGGAGICALGLTTVRKGGLEAEKQY